MGRRLGGCRAPLDADPSEPATRNFTTALATLETGWYIIRWQDAAASAFDSDPVLYPATGTAADSFITVNELGDYLGRDVTADNGAAIAVDAACEVIRTMTGQTFNAGSSTVQLDGTGTDALPLPEFPANTIGSVVVGGTVDSGTITGGSAVTNWTLRSDGVLLRTAGAATSTYTEEVLPLRWPKGRQNVAVTYTHGYGTVPSDIRMAALHIASRLIVQGVAQYETVGDVSMRYGTNATDFTAGERILFSKYRRHR